MHGSLDKSTGETGFGCGASQRLEVRMFNAFFQDDLLNHRRRRPLGLRSRRGAADETAQRRAHGRD